MVILFDCYFCKLTENTQNKLYQQIGVYVMSDYSDFNQLVSRQTSVTAGYPKRLEDRSFKESKRNRRGFS